mgnify:CR=1 FL=1
MTDMINSTVAVRRHGTNLPKEQFDMNVQYVSILLVMI